MEGGINLFSGDRDDVGLTRILSILFSSWNANEIKFLNWQSFLNVQLYFLLQFYAFLKTRTCVNSKVYPLKSAGASRSGPVTTCQSRDPADKSQGRVSPARTNHNTDPQHERRYLTKVATIYEIMLVLNTAVKCLG